MSDTCEQTWLRRRNDPRYNTSYPLQPADWQPYRAPGALPFAERELAFYLHVPFCASLCSFCEYTRMRVPHPRLQEWYIDRAGQDMQRFTEEHSGCTLLGFDIGGGTPMVLAERPFSRLLELHACISAALPHAPGYEPSIEGTFATLTAQRARLVAQAGIRRVSLGLQSTSARVLDCNGRSEMPPEMLREKIAMAHAEGIRTVNVDLMYGLRGQRPEDIAADLEQIARLDVDQVTLYELRTNMIAESPTTTADERYAAYCTLHRGLDALGYRGEFGRNTFSRREGECGCSSYLEHRMESGCAYKGFGISAQSMSGAGISYNIGKNAASLPVELPGYESGGDTYLLPPRELAAKYLAIAAYCGHFSLDVLTSKLGEPAEACYGPQLEFCLERGLMERRGSRVSITREGFRHYGAVFSLFYAPEPPRS